MLFNDSERRNGLCDHSQQIQEICCVVTLQYSQAGSFDPNLKLLEGNGTQRLRLFILTSSTVTILNVKTRTFRKLVLLPSSHGER
jgi:hypothetical protein